MKGTGQGSAVLETSVLRIAVSVLSLAAVLASPAASEPGPDALVIAAKPYLTALGPLIRFRSGQGLRVSVIVLEDLLSAGSGSVATKADLNSAPPKILGAIRKAYEASEQGLRYVLLVGDAWKDMKPPDGLWGIPTWFIDCDGEVATDAPYGNMDEDEEPDLAVGRLPVRSIAELQALVAKIIRYETDRKTGLARRRTVFLGGSPNFGADIDPYFEAAAMALAGTLLPVCYDIRAMYASAASPYCYPLKDLGKGFAREIEAGPPLVLFVGHGSEGSLCGAPSGESIVNADANIIQEGTLCGPLFCFCCSSGRFEGPGDCVVEAFLKAKAGPVATFAAASGTSPKENLLLAEALLLALSDPPERLGDLTLLLKSPFSTVHHPVVSLAVQVSKARNARWDEAFYHRTSVARYNLFGDPTTRLMLPQLVDLSIDETGQGSGSRIAGLKVSTEVSFAPSSFMLTLERDRQETPGMKELMKAGPSLERFEMANQRVISYWKGKSSDKQLSGALPVPEDLKAGKYLVKLYAASFDQDAMGGAWWERKGP